MPLTNFFRINLPYGIAIKEDGSAMVFNREYLPVGINQRSEELQLDRTTIPVWTHYKGLTEKLLLRIAGNGQIDRYDNGKIKKVWLYDDSTNPSVHQEYWAQYSEKVQLLSNLERKYHS